MARYGQAYKDRVVARLLPPESAEIDEVSRAVGLSVTTLPRWRAEGSAARLLRGGLPCSGICRDAGEIDHADDAR
jgi:hypothetical protein